MQGLPGAPGKGEKPQASPAGSSLVTPKLTCSSRGHRTLCRVNIIPGGREESKVFKLEQRGLLAPHWQLTQARTLWTPVTPREAVLSLPDSPPGVNLSHRQPELGDSEFKLEMTQH